MRALFVVVVLLSGSAWSQTVYDFDPHVRARPVDGGLLLEWNALNDAGVVTVRSQDAGSVSQITNATLDAGATSFFVADFPTGSRRVFRVQRTQQGGVFGEGVVVAGVEAPFVDDPGVVLVLIDQENGAALTTEIVQLANDLRDDGFGVVVQFVQRAETPPEVKARILAVADAGSLTSVVLLGAVPRAFSGIQYPDGHMDHRGAWPADPYYAELQGTTWTDTTSGGEGQFFNDAGDGKFDQNQTSSPVDVAVGRVDFENMPVFGGDAGTVVLSRYLAKVHRFRTGEAPLPRRALVKDSFGYFSGESFARAAWRDSTAIIGEEPTPSNFFPALEDGGVLLAWGCGGGSSTSASGVTNSTELSMKPANARLMAMFGSYFGDWRYTNNLLRASLGSGEVVASMWFARPQVQLHALGALESFGSAYSKDPALRWRSMPVFQGLLGDPTLRIFYPLRLTGLMAVPVSDGISLSWNAYAGDGELVGYHVYRSDEGARPQRISGLVNATSFVDSSAPQSGAIEYRAVAVIRETTGSGTFWNHSLGARVMIFGAPPFDAGVPVVDAGVEPVDAGSEEPEDGGSVGEPDGGYSPLPVDPEPQPEQPSGCGCTSASALLPLALMAALFRRRRRV